MTNISRLILNLIRRLQQKNRFMGRAQHSGLTPVETHFLLELDADSTRSISQLAELLGVDQSFGSRIAQGLKKKKLISSDTLEKDARKKLLRITEQGRSLIQVIDSVSNDRYERFALTLTSTERERLTLLFRLIADGFGQEPGIKRSTEVTFRVEQRRVTRALGLLGEKVFGTTYSTTQWQLLSEVVNAPVPPQPTELAEALSLAQNSVSSIISSLEAARLIKREGNKADRRSVVLRSLPKGVEKLSQIEAQALTKINNVVKRYSQKEIDQFVSVLRKYVGEYDGMSPTLTTSYTLRAFKNGEIAALRGAFLRLVVAQGLENELPEQILSSSSEVFALYRENILVAVAEAQRKPLPNIPLCSWSRELTPWTLLGFVSRIQETLSTQDKLPLERFVGFKPLREYLDFQK